EVEHLELELLTVISGPFHGELSGTRYQEVGSPVLVAESVAADDDRIGPAWDQARHVGDDDRLTENDSAEDVANRAVRRLPHLLEAEFLDTGLVGRDRRAFDADAMLLDRVGRVDR